MEPSFQGINRLFIQQFESYTQSTKDCYLPNVELKDYDIMINGKNFIDQPIKNIKVTYENITKITIGQGNDYTSDCLLDYSYLKESYKMVSVDPSRQQILDNDPRANQQIDFPANLDRVDNKKIYFILEEAEETILDISQGTVKVL